MKLFSDTNNQAGITLVELIVSIVVIAVAVSGVLLAVQFTTRHSADPMIRQQAVAIADAYMEEILLKPYEDPGGSGGTSRRNYNYVYDYNEINSTEPKDQNGDSMGLNNYLVTVDVEKTNFGPDDKKAANATVTVTHKFADVKFVLTGYKAKY